MKLPVAAFALAVSLPATLAAQSPDTTHLVAGGKSTTTAFLLGLAVPGLGHFYADSPTRGVAIMAAVVGGIAFGVSQLNQATAPCTERPGRTCPPEDDHSGPAAAGFTIATCAWIFSLYDAQRVAERYNREHGYRVTITPGVNGRTNVGLGVRF